MKAPDKIYVNIPGDFWHSGPEKADTDTEYIRKTAMLEWAKKQLETNLWFYDTHKKPNELHYGRVEAFKRVIEIIESL